MRPTPQQLGPTPSNGSVLLLRLFVGRSPGWRGTRQGSRHLAQEGFVVADKVCGKILSINSRFSLQITFGNQPDSDTVEFHKKDRLFFPSAFIVDDSECNLEML